MKLESKSEYPKLHYADPRDRNLQAISILRDGDFSLKVGQKLMSGNNSQAFVASGPNGIQGLTARNLWNCNCPTLC